MPPMYMHEQVCTILAIHNEIIIKIKESSMHRNSWRFVRNNGCLDTSQLEPPKYWGYGIYIDFRFALPIPFFVYL